MRKSTKYGWLLALSTLAVAPASAQQTAPAPAKKAKEEGKSAPRPAEPTKKVDADADRMLRQMTDYLAGLKQFRVRASSVDQVVTKDGRKIQIAADSDIAVRRPNGLMSAQVPALKGLSFYYDGKTMTAYCKANNTYRTVPAPATLDDTIDVMRSKYGLEAPGADLIASKPYDALMEQVKAGQFIGRETIAAVPANHLAFTGETVDWQVWIKEGAEPLPLRFVVTTKDMKAQPEFSLQLSQWEPQATVPDATFQFQAPAGATRVDAIPNQCGEAHRMAP